MSYPPGHVAPPPSQRELQHQTVADLGQLALRGCELGALLDAAVDGLATCLNLRYVKVLELAQDRMHLTMRSGVGWNPGLVGAANVPADAGSQAGFTLLSEDTIVVRDFATEERFAAPKLLSDHGICCGASVIIGPVEDPWGVLGVHESELGRCAFDRYDIDFVRSIANVLWLFIRNEKDREEAERERRSLRSFADSMPILFAIVGRNGRYEYASQGYRAFGVDPARLRGKRVSGLIGDAAFEQIRPHVDKVLAGTGTSYETRIKVGAQGERDVLVTYSPRRSGSGDVDGYYAAIVDISDQKRVQRVALERNEQFRAIADSIPYGIWTCNPAGRLTYVSDSFLDLVGMSFSEAADFGWLSKLLPRDAEETRQAWEHCVAHRQDWEREHRLIGSDGRYYDVLAIARPVFDTNGNLTGYVGLNLDITERKRREETLALVTAELDHRVKNVFSLVASIARQASRGARSIEEFRQGFEGRLRALADAHDLIAEGNWESLPLRRLVEIELEPYEGASRASSTVDGPEVDLQVHAGQPLALALHELATNAAKYGALKGPEGAISVRWAMTETGGLDLVWEESGLEDVVEPERSGFGSRVLNHVLSQQLGADVCMEFRPTGLRARIELPSDIFLQR